MQVFNKAEPKTIRGIDVEDGTTSSRNNFLDALAIDQLSQGIFVQYSKLTELQEEASFEFLLRTVSPLEKKKVLQFHKKDDQKRSLLSILLQRSAIRYVHHFTIFCMYIKCPHIYWTKVTES